MIGEKNVNDCRYDIKQRNIQDNLLKEISQIRMSEGRMPKIHFVRTNQTF